MLDTIESAPVLPAPPSSRLERRVTLALTVGPFVAFLLAVVLFWRQGISGTDLFLMIALYFATGFGVTIGYHRLFTHRSFKAGPRLRATLAVLASLAVQGSVIAWVADHRRHHELSDREGDPHSPNLDERRGLRGVLGGLWHAHIGWLFRPASERTSRQRYAPDMTADASMRRIDALFPVLVVASFALPAALGLVLTGSWIGMLTALLWGGLVRVFFLHHVTWSINSICHFYGRRPYDSRDLSTNNWPLAIVSMGESWHNNHHAFPTSAVHGFDRGQIDMTGRIILALRRVGLARDVKRFTPLEREVKRLG